MSTVIVVTPLIIAGWPLLTAAIAGAIGSMGFSMAQNVGSTIGRVSSRRSNTTRAEIEVDDAEILAEAGNTGEQLVVERDGIRAAFSRDARGALKLCVEGEAYTERQLREIGEQLIGRVTQQFVYHRLMSELQEQQMEVVEQRMEEDQSITIRVRNA